MNTKRIEIFKDIPNYKGLYQVSNIGNVKSIKTNKLKSFSDNGNNYLYVDLYKANIRKKFRVHQLVAMAFLNHNPNIDGLVVNHKNFKRKDNRVENLELITQRENTNQKHLKSTSKYVGVHLCADRIKNKWSSNIYINGIQKFLGRYDNEYDAHLAYQSKLLTLNK